MPINYGELIKLYEGRDAGVANDLLREMCLEKDVNPYNVDVGKLFAECYGWHEFRTCREQGRSYLANDVMRRTRLTEATGAVTSDAFLNIIGQITYSMTLDAYDAVENVFTKLIPEVMTQFLDGEKIAGVTEIGDEIAVRPETQPYALAGVSEDWIFTPPIVDRGDIVPLTWEAVFQDRTGLLQQRCKDVGKWGGINREKRAIDAVIDENATNHRYNWRSAGQIATYNDNTGSHTWDNLAASNALTDWQNVNTAEQLFNAITDPYTGEVIEIEAKHLIVTRQLEQTARRIVRQGTLAVTTPGYATSGQPSQHTGDNPYGAKYEVVTSKRLAPRMATKTSWFLGDVGAAVRCMVAEKPAVLAAPANNKDEFERRIVQQWRFNERTQYVVIQPRALEKNTVA